jgi:hypothetical protein
MHWCLLLVSWRAQLTSKLVHFLISFLHPSFQGNGEVKPKVGFTQMTLDHFHGSGIVPSERVISVSTKPLIYKHPKIHFA